LALAEGGVVFLEVTVEGEGENGGQEQGHGHFDLAGGVPDPAVAVVVAAVVGRAHVKCP